MRASIARQSRRLLVIRQSSLLGISRASYITSSRPRPRTCVSTPTPRAFRRSFFKALFQKPPREIRPPEYEPGWMAIMVWRSRMLDNLRPQPRKELMDAWRKLMESKLRTKTPLNSTQAIQCRRLLQYLHERAQDGEEAKPLPLAELAKARQVLLDIEPHERSQNHVDLADALYTVLQSKIYSGKPRHRELQWSYLVKAMARYGASRGAMDLLVSKWNDPATTEILKGEKLVAAVAEGLAREGLEKELIELIQLSDQRGGFYDSTLQEIVTTFYSKQDRVEETRKWFSRSIPQRNAKASTYLAIAYFARRNNLQEWALPIFHQLELSKPRRKLWEVLLQGLLVLGKDIGEVKLVMSTMNGPDGPLAVDTGTINSLLKASLSLEDMQLAEKISSLSEDLKIEPDGEAFLILWQLQLQRGNLEEAERPYRQVQYLEPWESETKPELDKEYEQTLNRYLVTLAGQSPPNFSFLTKVLENVEEQSARLEPSTVAVLCLRFLENDQHFDVMDILSAHSFFYSGEEREVIQTAFLDFCQNARVSTARAWSGYQILQQFFQDLSFENRSSLMEEFLRRKRSDMAGHVFGHMRAHRNKDYHPKMDTYIRCLEGIAQHPNAETLAMVHNMLKMDMRVQPNTDLLTALMLAHAGCSQPISALDFWTEITQSKQGPSYASLEAVFWTLEKKSRGHTQAQEIWEKLVKMDVEVGPPVYSAYVGAVAAGGDVAVVQKLINGMASVVGSPPDEMTLAIAYNALPGQQLQKEFEEWAKKSHRGLWADLLKSGRRMNEYSLCQFKIRRVLKAKAE